MPPVVHPPPSSSFPPSPQSGTPPPPPCARSMLVSWVAVAILLRVPPGLCLLHATQTCIIQLSARKAQAMCIPCFFPQPKAGCIAGKVRRGKEGQGLSSVSPCAPYPGLTQIALPVSANCISGAETSCRCTARTTVTLRCSPEDNAYLKFCLSCAAALNLLHSLQSQHRCVGAWLLISGERVLSVTQILDCRSPCPYSSLVVQGLKCSKPAEPP